MRDHRLLRLPAVHSKMDQEKDEGDNAAHYRDGCEARHLVMYIIFKVKYASLLRQAKVKIDAKVKEAGIAHSGAHVLIFEFLVHFHLG